jgi:rubrerythrin
MTHDPNLTTGGLNAPVGLPAAAAALAGAVPQPSDATPAAPVPDRQTVCDTLNSLLRGEIAATETYRMAIDRFEDKPEHTQVLEALRRLHINHAEAVRLLKERLVELGGKPVEGSGLWGAWARFAQGSGNLLGSQTSLVVLRESEENGLDSYEDAAASLDAESRDQIATQLLPRHQQHLATLKKLIDRLDRA